MKVACLQMTSSMDVASNLAAVEAGFESLDSMPEWVVLPENFVAMTKLESQKKSIAETLDDGPIQEKLSAWAKRYGCWLVAGTIPIHSERSDKVYATSLVYDNLGKRRHRYNKHFLFDVVVNNQESYLESDTIERGVNLPHVFDSPYGRVGVAICYDLRFAEVFLHFVAQKVDYIVLPAAFTYHTGSHHWLSLLKTRAIETQSFVIACNQGGVHENGRRTFGHSAIFDPYGTLLGNLEEAPGWLQADCPLEAIESVRQAMPMALHRIQAKIVSDAS